MCVYTYCSLHCYSACVCIHTAVYTATVYVCVYILQFTLLQCMCVYTYCSLHCYSVCVCVCESPPAERDELLECGQFQLSLHRLLCDCLQSVQVDLHHVLGQTLPEGARGEEDESES